MNQSDSKGRIMTQLVFTTSRGTLRGSLVSLLFTVAPVAYGTSVVPSTPDVAVSAADGARVTCQAGIASLLGGADAVFADEAGATLHGFQAALGSGSTGEPLKVSFVASTGTDAYFYTETCDICAELIKCDLVTGEAAFFKSEHTLSCGDLPALPEGAVVDLECRAN
jgi:hypothetical protein